MPSATDNDLRPLYEAARRADLSNATSRTFEEWCDKVSDYGLYQARAALEMEIDTERLTLEREVIEAAKEWRSDWLMKARRLRLAVDALEQFESDHKPSKAPVLQHL